MPAVNVLCSIAKPETPQEEHPKNAASDQSRRYSNRVRKRASPFTGCTSKVNVFSRKKLLGSGGPSSGVVQKLVAVSKPNSAREMQPGISCHAPGNGADSAGVGLDPVEIDHRLEPLAQAGVGVPTQVLEPASGALRPVDPGQSRVEAAAWRERALQAVQLAGVLVCADQVAVDQHERRSHRVRQRRADLRAEMRAGFVPSREQSQGVVPIAVRLHDFDADRRLEQPRLEAGPAVESVIAECLLK